MNIEYSHSHLNDLDIFHSHNNPQKLELKSNFWGLLVNHLSKFYRYIIILL